MRCTCHRFATGFVAFLVATALIAGDRGEESLTYRLTLDDCVSHDVLGPIEIQENRVLFHLAGGRLASLPVERVTAVTPLSPPVADRFAGEATGRRDRRASEEPGDLGRFTNEDLPPPLPNAGSVAYATGEPEQVEATLTYEGYRDRTGRGEDWWRERARRTERDLSDAKTEMEEAYAELHSLTRGLGGGLVLPEQGRLLHAIQRARERFEAAEERYRNAVEERSRLADEARQAEALPGWLR